jgi:hypothetical protein
VLGGLAFISGCGDSASGGMDERELVDAHVDARAAHQLSPVSLIAAGTGPV